MRRNHKSGLNPANEDVRNGSHDLTALVLLSEVTRLAYVPPNLQLPDTLG